MTFSAFERYIRESCDPSFFQTCRYEIRYLCRGEANGAYRVKEVIASYILIFKIDMSFGMLSLRPQFARTQEDDPMLFC